MLSHCCDAIDILYVAGTAPMALDSEDVPSLNGRKSTAFSVVLFRPHCMLVSEEYLMKAHKNQWLLTVSDPPEHLSGAPHRGHTMAPEAQKPSQ